mmetsp:Transcript_166411/g.528640  ORF Transcript_166411/g.528640 Transcript_166411/m.528640 type:complete len:321 (-) Transcript_166411:4-966(-)
MLAYSFEHRHKVCQSWRCVEYRHTVYQFRIALDDWKNCMRLLEPQQRMEQDGHRKTTSILNKVDATHTALLETLVVQHDGVQLQDRNHDFNDLLGRPSQDAIKIDVPDDDKFDEATIRGALRNKLDAVLQRLAVKHKVQVEVQRVLWNASAGSVDQSSVLSAVGQHLPQPPKRPLQGREASQKTRHKQHVLNVVGRRTQLRVLLRCESLPQRLDLRLLAGRWPAHARLGCLRVGGAGTPRCLLLLTARPEHKDHEGCNNEHERARASEIHQRCRSGYGIERPLHRCMLGPMCKSLAEAPMQRGVVENAVVENCVRGAVGK